MRKFGLKKLAPLGATAAVAAAMFVGAPGALANQVSCPSGSTYDCTATYNYTGGATQAKITIDMSGSSTAPLKAFFYNPNGSTNCYINFTPAQPPTTWYCNWAGGHGTYKLEFLMIVGYNFSGYVSLSAS